MEAGGFCRDAGRLAGVAGFPDAAQLSGSSAALELLAVIAGVASSLRWGSRLTFILRFRGTGALTLTSAHANANPDTSDLVVF